MKVQIVTHTGSDLPLEEAQKLGVAVVPDIVMFGETEYNNMFDLSAEEFFDKLRTAGELPTSSHPTVGDMSRVFVEKSLMVEEILFLAVTSKMSGSFAAAETARDMAIKQGAKAKIYVYDTMQCSHAMAEMVREAQRLANEGRSATEIISQLDEYRHKMGQYFILDTLQYARKGGRVGAIKALAADTMKIKPLLVFDDGLVRDIGIAKNFDDGLDKVLEKYKAEADFTKPITIFHLDALDKAQKLASMVRDINPTVETRIGYVGPVIAIYAGPGGAGLSFVKK